jgi:hypothetical protein
VRFGGGGGGGGGDDDLGIGCPLLNVAGLLLSEDNLPMGNRVEGGGGRGGGNNGLFSNSLTLSEIAGSFSGSVFFSEDDTNVPYNLLGSAPYPLFSFSEIYLQTQMIHTNNILSKSTHSDTNLKCYGFQTP